MSIRIDCKKHKFSKLPMQAVLNSKTMDTDWNYIPLGIIDDSKQSVVGWHMKDYADTERIGAVGGSLLLIGGVGSGTSVVEKSILYHMNKFRPNFQIIGADILRTPNSKPEFCKLGDKIDIVLQDRQVIADALLTLQRLMMNRFRLMEKAKVSNYFKISGRKVPYYIFNGKTYQFDKLFEVEACLENQEAGESQGDNYPYEKHIDMMTIEDIYKTLRDKPEISLTVNGQKLGRLAVEETTGILIPQDITMFLPNFQFLMDSDDYTSVDKIKYNLSSIMRLGKAAGISIVLGVNKLSSKAIPSDLLDNIQTIIVLGDFDQITSIRAFGRDLSDESRPDIRGRGIIRVYSHIHAIQIFDKIIL